MYVEFAPFVGVYAIVGWICLCSTNGRLSINIVITDKENINFHV